MAHVEGVESDLNLMMPNNLGSPGGGKPAEHYDWSLKTSRNSLQGARILLID